jgi:hypothetical protein
VRLPRLLWLLLLLLLGPAEGDVDEAAGAGAMGGVPGRVLERVRPTPRPRVHQCRRLLLANMAAVPWAGDGLPPPPPPLLPALLLRPSRSGYARLIPSRPPVPVPD